MPGEPLIAWGLPVLPSLALVLLGAFLAVEQVALAQLQLSHPLVAGALAGLLTGHPLEGALIGALLGLLVAGHRPVGGVIPPDGGPAALVAAACLGGADGAGGGVSGGALAVALLAGLLLAELGRHSEAWTRHLNRNLVRWAEAEATPESVERAVRRALLLAATRGALTVALGLPLAAWLVGRLGGGGPAPAVVVAVVGGVGLAAQTRLLSYQRWRGFCLAVIGAMAAIAAGGGW